MLRHFIRRTSRNQHVGNAGRMLNLKRAVPGVDDLQMKPRHWALRTVYDARKLNVAHFALPLPLHCKPYDSQPASNAGHGNRHPPRLDTHATMPIQPCMPFAETSMIARARLEICEAGGCYLGPSGDIDKPIGLIPLGPFTGAERIPSSVKYRGHES